VPGTIALTFDDGPHADTETILDVLEAHGVRATFFICGNNNPKGSFDDPDTPWGATLRRMYDAGHQMASHTWTHADLSVTSPAVRQQQVVFNEMAFRNLFGFFPTYLRPPYASCSAECQADMDRWGYHVINFDLDTRDFINDAPDLIGTSKDIFSQAVSSDAAGHSYNVLAHDIHHYTALELTDYMILTLKERGYRAVTVGECLGDPAENWYRDAEYTSTGEPAGVHVPNRHKLDEGAEDDDDDEDEDETD